MKLLSIICLILLACAFVSAHNHGCDGHGCPSGTICLRRGGHCECIDIPRCKEVDLSIKTVTTWTVNGATFTQYDVTINNHLDVDVKEIFIGTDYTFKLKDNDNKNLWNMERCSDNELTLSKYQPSINKNAGYTFGFILCGTQAPNLAILGVTY